MHSSRTDENVAVGFLDYLRDKLDTPNLDYAEPLARILGGYDTQIYSLHLANATGEWARPLILRVFRDETSPEQARYEAAVQAAIADQGFPAPRPLHVCGDKSVLGGAFFIMERVPGHVLLDFTSPVFFRMGIIMAEWQAKLHSLDVAPLVGALKAAQVPPERYAIESRIARVTDEVSLSKLEGLQPVVQWLTDNRPLDTPTPVICHDDFHPMNILVHKGQVSGVIDWAGVALAPPEYDVGASIAIFKHGPVGLPGFAAPLVDAVRGRILRRYRKRYEELSPLDASTVDYFEALRSVGFLTESGRHIQAQRGVLPPTDKPNPFGGVRQLRRVRERIEEITGIAATLPG